MTRGHKLKPGLRSNQVTASSPDSKLLPVLQLSQSIFDPENLTPENPYFLLSAWKDRLIDPKAIILYATTIANEASQDPSLHGQAPSETPLGFFFAHPKTQREIGHETLHLWIAGVDPSARGLGVFPFLMHDLKQHGKACGSEYLSVCTYPKRFKNMYRILQKHEWETVAWRDSGEKVLMKLKV